MSTRVLEGNKIITHPGYNVGMGAATNKHILVGGFVPLNGVTAAFVTGRFCVGLAFWQARSEMTSCS